MSVSSINPSSPVNPPVQPVAPPAPQVRDPDHDGDSDGGRVRSTPPRGVGGTVDKDV
jgi:hypothetical protein